MNKIEFLERLRKALGNDLSAAIVQEHVNYYNQYISDEVAKGRSEQEVVEELGDPWAIAQNVIDVEGGKSGNSRVRDYETGSRSSGSYESETFYGSDYGSVENSAEGNKPIGKWSLILFVVGIVAVLILIVAIIGGIISILAPIIIPVLVIVLLIQLITRLMR